MTEQEHAPRWSASPKARLVACTLVVAGCYLAQGLFYARTLLPSGDMVQYLVAGRLAVRGEISLFDDRLHGNRPPLPFYVLGLTQLWGPSLLAARGANIVWGLATLLLTALLARRLGGAGAGVLAASFLAAQGVRVRRPDGADARGKPRGGGPCRPPLRGLGAGRRPPGWCRGRAAGQAAGASAVRRRPEPAPRRVVRIHAGGPARDIQAELE